MCQSETDKSEKRREKARERKKREGERERGREGERERGREGERESNVDLPDFASPNRDHGNQGFWHCIHRPPIHR